MDENDFAMNEKLDKLISLAVKQNKLLSQISGWVAFFGIMAILYIVFQIINFILLLSP